MPITRFWNNLHCVRSAFKNWEFKL